MPVSDSAAHPTLSWTQPTPGQRPQVITRTLSALPATEAEPATQARFYRFVGIGYLALVTLALALAAMRVVIAPLGS